MAAVVGLEAEPWRCGATELSLNATALESCGAVGTSWMGPQGCTKREDGQEENSAVGASPPEGAAQRTGKNWDGIAALRSTCSLSASTCSPPALANTSGAL